MRTKFSRLLTDAALKDERILLLTGDHGYALFDEFRKECPDQYINCGIAEQNMVGVAAGLAKTGYRPIVYGLAAFVPMRVLEQIKMDVCYEQLPVIFIGDGAGVVYSHLGTSHQCTEDIAALRAIPHIDIYSPCDVEELGYVFKQMTVSNRPSYLRFGKADLGAVHIASIANIKLGDLVCVHKAKGNRAIIATGSMVSTALRLAKKYDDISLWSAPVISPINRVQVLEIARQSKTLYVMEEHSINGGLAGLIAEITSSTPYDSPCKIVSIGIKERFSEFCGTYAYLLSEHGLDDKQIDKVISSD